MAMSGDPAFDREVRLHVFRRAANTGTVPQPQEIAAALGASRDAIQRSLQRLADGRVIVLAPGGASIWMANPFSAVPTDFTVTSRGRRYFGNCIWDALGIPALLEADAVVETACGDCRESMVLEVRRGVLAGAGVVHFAVPANRWWVNIGYT